MPRRLRPWKDSMSPTRPMIVRVTPRLTNACPPVSSTRSVTWAICSSVAPGAITTTMVEARVRRPDAGTDIQHPISDCDVRDLRLDLPARGTSSTISIAASTSAPPSSIRSVADSPPSSTAKSAAKTGSMLMMIAVRVGGRWACAQVWPSSAAAPATSAM